ncbi:Peptidase C14, caspase catalytic subunit p20 [Plesiocystis pacifica SIR-1]|uniref:Peptidase C14, caspase catalytic subunit p20 n=1 Tax=Plesiocystis pacifica SIR-1 TaxID=391625 RepID=A6G5L8_9BACT|nr:protein kinase [Plesiocystis pacifica]EDM78799.1 Peptidase C14, caspase catalytic subunit p20 [Plesiocystis pacifica SIR-1]
MDVEDEGKGRPSGQPDPTHRAVEAGPSAKAGVERGIETRRQKAAIEAALFGEPDEEVTPIRIGRFIVVRELGAGGMGVVYLAYDEELDRRVAVKLLRRDHGDAEAQARLQREAQAMARLNSPHVVTVHEVGTHEGQVFVAMEYVKGYSLRGWLRDNPKRDQAELMALFFGAGEGLAAAHEAGIVHRDFKPDNVLVGEDGRVRVADFGLAHALELSSEAEQTSSIAHVVQERRAGVSASNLDTPLTKTGAIMGTPAYMAPEQFAGEPTDERTDQFAFCVALWEGLYGRRPYAGLGLADLIVAVNHRRITEPPPERAREVPSWLRERVLRGLSPDPADRWPSMRALLDALANDPIARRRRLLEAGLGAAAVGAVLLASTTLATSELQDNARQRYWSALTEELLELERERSFRQVSADAERSRDATRMSVFRRYRPQQGAAEREDPTVAAALLREVEGEARGGEAWVSAANEILNYPLSHVVAREHDGLITWMVFSPEGDTLYTSAFDGTVRRWSTATGASERIVQHEAPIDYLALSPDGRRLVSGSKDGEVRLWSVDEPELSKVIAKHELEITDLRFDPSGALLGTASMDGTIKLTQMPASLDPGARVRPPRVLEVEPGRVFALAFDPTGAVVFSGGDDARVRAWRVEDGALLATFEGHEQPIYFLETLATEGAGPSATYAVASGSDDGTLRLWRTTSAGPLDEGGAEVLARFGDPISSLETSLASGAVAAGTVLGAIGLVREVPTRPRGGAPSPELEPLSGHRDGVWSLAFNTTGERLFSGSFDGSAREWSTANERAPKVYTGHPISVFSVATDRQGRWLATGGYDGELRIWDRSAEQPSVELMRAAGRLGSMAVDPEGRWVVAGTSKGSLERANLDGGALGRVVVGDAPITALALAPSSAEIVAGTAMGTLAWWRFDAGEGGVGVLERFEAHRDKVWDLAFDPAGARLAVASFDGRVSLWDARDHSLEGTLEGHTDFVMRVAFVSAGRLLSAGRDGSLRLWQVDEGRELARDTFEGARINDLARSPEPGVWAGAMDSGRVAVWRVGETIERVQTFSAHDNQVWSVSFDATGERLLSTSFDGTAKLWSVADGELLASLEGHREQLWAGAFVDEQRVVTVSDDSTARLWSLDVPGTPSVPLPHGDAVLGVLPVRAREAFVTHSLDGRVLSWELAGISGREAALQARLESATTLCLSPAVRMRELGEERKQAEREHSACERRQGRGP